MEAWPGEFVKKNLAKEKEKCIDPLEKVLPSRFVC
jgi:hypothetical protein